MRREARQEILAFSILFVAAFLAVSLYSYCAEDVLLHGLWSMKAQNAGGPLGAVLAHGFLSWLGRAASTTLVALTALSGITLLFRRRVEATGWKLAGAVILLLAVSALEVASSGTDDYLDYLPGGYYGQFAYGFLFTHLERFGAFLLLLYALLVAFLISTDTLIYPAFARSAQLAYASHRYTKSVASRGGAVLIERLRDWSSTVVAGAGKAWRKRTALLPRTADVPASGKPLLKPLSSPRPAPVIRGLDPNENSVLPQPATSATARPNTAKNPEKPSAKSGDKVTAPKPIPLLDPDDEELVETAAASPTVIASPTSAAQDDKKPESVAADPTVAPAPRPPIRINVSEAAVKPLPYAGQAERKLGNYKLPELGLLMAPAIEENLDRGALQETARVLEETLKNFKIEAQVVEIQKGPVITQYELSLAAGIKVHTIMALSDDLAMALKAPSIRIVAPIPGKSTVGVEVPNRHRGMVGLRELLTCREYHEGRHKIPLLLGKDAAGKPIISDLGEMPHLLIAGSTGAGKSVCINAVITNLLMTKTPEELKLILVDPKMVELSSFEDIPHLLTPVVTDMKKAPAVLNWLVEKMDERYELLAMVGVRNIQSYNALGRDKLTEILKARGELDDESIAEIPDLLPYYVMIIDELADLMMTASKEVEASIIRLSQKSRAVGIHLILATQRPSVNVITGLIKANMPSRISFHVASKVDSRTILDRNGAEKLLGKGDMLYLPPGTSNVVRAQGTFISDPEIRDIVKFVRNQAEPQFNHELSRFDGIGGAGGGEADEMYDQAVRAILESQRGSATLLQRALQIGYTRATRLLELMHENGLVGPFKGSKAREVYYTIDEWDTAKAKAASGAAESSSAASESKPDEEDV